MLGKRHVSRQFQPSRTTALFIVCLLTLFPALAVADLVIQLTSGQRIVVPVDKDQIESIVFTGSGAQVEKEVPAGQASERMGVKQRAQGNILSVGPKRKLKYPSDAARVARDGDIVEIDAGVYRNDHASWRQSDITIRGVGGMAHLNSKGLIPNGKAIWIVNGNNVSIENIEFSGAAVKDTNGAGIRHQGGNLKLRNTFFHDNEFSILSGTLPNADISIESSRFWFQKRPQRHSHGIYIGLARRLTLVGNHFKGTDQGHQVKSRALENHILYNRIEDVPGANSSRLVDLSNCGLSFVIGNDLHQAATSANLNAIGYGPEGCGKRSGRQMALYVINNTFINEADGGAFVRNFAGGDVTVANNLVFGRGDFLVGKGVESENVRLPLGSRLGRTWSAPAGSEAIDTAAVPPKVEEASLVPTMEFSPPAGTRERPRFGRLDIGSRESAR
jgi:hypothetical protein